MLYSVKGSPESYSEVFLNKVASQFEHITANGITMAIPATTTQSAKVVKKGFKALPRTGAEVTAIGVAAFVMVASGAVLVRRRKG